MTSHKCMNAYFDPWALKQRPGNSRHVFGSCKLGITLMIRAAVHVIRTESSLFLIAAVMLGSPYTNIIQYNIVIKSFRAYITKNDQHLRLKYYKLQWKLSFKCWALNKILSSQSTWQPSLCYNLGRWMSRSDTSDEWHQLSC